MIKAIGCVFFIFAAVAAPRTGYAKDIHWVEWSRFKAGIAGSATGYARVDASKTITVTYSGELEPGLSVIGGGYTRWLPQSSFTSAVVGDAPKFASIIAFFGGAKSGIDTITFSAPVKDPVIAIWSLGQPGLTTRMVFADTPKILDEGGGPNAEYGGQPLVVRDHTVFGAEGNGTIILRGIFTQISWTTRAYEYWAGFTVGLPAQ